MARKINAVLIVLTILIVGGCAENNYQGKVGVINFQQCQPDLALKEIGLNNIQQRNDALECNRKGMPLVFAAELRNRLQVKLNREVQLISLDVPYNYNIQSQIDIAKRNNIDVLVGGMLERYIDSSAVQRGKKQGILPNTAILSPIMEHSPASTVVKANISVARTADREIIADFKLEEEGHKSADVYTSELADRIAEVVSKMH